MKDELEELTTDPSTRKMATDWLMRVISSKEPINLHLSNGVGQHEATPAAIAVHDEQLAVSTRTGEFSAEDLCGAPAVPVIKAPSVSDSITADDVCWVPEEMRLKPQIAAPEPAPLAPPTPPAPLAPLAPLATAPKVLQMGQSPAREAQPEPKIQEPESRKTPASLTELSMGRTALAAHPAINHEPLEEFVSLSDISREPAPYVVEPISGLYSDHFHQPSIDESPITAADIARDWVIQSMEPATGRERDGVVLPFSFKVLKPKEPAEAAPAEPEAQSRPAEVAEAAEPVPPAETVAAATEGPEVVESAPEAEAAAAIPVIQDNPPRAEAAPASVEPAHEIADSAETPAASAIEAQAVSNDVSRPDLLEIAAALETLEAAPRGGEFESEPMPMEAGREPGNGESLAPENVFAQEGFWDKARGESTAEVKALHHTPLFRDMEPQRPFPPPEKLGDGTSDKRPEGWFSAWKTLLRLGSVLPWVAQSLPALESGNWAEQGGPGAGAGGEMRQDVAGLRLVQYEIRTTVQDHSLQLKRVEEQLGRVRESLESKSSDKADLEEGVRSMAKLVRLVGIGLGSLLALLIVLVIILLAHGH